MAEAEDEFKSEREAQLARVGMAVLLPLEEKIECMHCHRMFNPASSMLADLPICDWCFDGS